MVSLLDRVTTTDQADELSPLAPFVYKASVGVSFLLSLRGAGAATGIGLGHLEDLLTVLVQLREGQWTAQSKDRGGKEGGDFHCLGPAQSQPVVTSSWLLPSTVYIVLISRSCSFLYVNIRKGKGKKEHKNQLKYSFVVQLLSHF